MVSEKCEQRNLYHGEKEDEVKRTCFQPIDSDIFPFGLIAFANYWWNSAALGLMSAPLFSCVHNGGDCGDIAQALECCDMVAIDLNCN